MTSVFAFNFAQGTGLGRETSPPRPVRTGDYPVDLDGSLRYARPATGWSFFPIPATYPNGAGIGAVSGILRQFDAAVYAQMVARLPAGPGVDSVPFDPMRYIYQATYPQLPQIGDTGTGGTSS